MTRKVGILAYGSLIDDPGGEIEAVKVNIKSNVKTPFPIEFARSSSTRKGAPTLIPVIDGGACVAAIIYEVGVKENEAADILYRRERRKVGTNIKYSTPAPEKKNAVRVERLENFEGFDVVLYTKIGTNIDVLNADTLADCAIKSVKGAEQGRDGITYLVRAKRNGIKTPLSPAYEEQILGKLGAKDLDHALEIARDL